MRKSKYKSIKTEVEGIVFHSKKEAARYRTLLLLKKATGNDKVLDIELQPRYDYEIQYHANGRIYTKKSYYKADFKVKYKNRIEVEDVKGFKTATYKRKKKIVESLYNINIIEI